MIGAPFAAFCAIQFGDWKLIFLVFGIVSILSALWLGSVKIDELKVEGQRVTFGSAFKLLGNRFILMMVMSIFVVVGIDVGFNSNSGQFLIRHFGIEDIAAESGRSIYFFGKMLGTFLGAILLTRLSPRKFFVWTSILGIIALVIIIFSTAHFMAWILVFVIGLTVANIWPLVFSITIEKYPDRGNEVSGLMMMAICGGAVIPLLMGWITDLSSAMMGMAVLILCMVYLLGVALYTLKK